ncbi:putative cytochrome P450, partial [Xylariales sp. AK1849]
MALYLVYLGAGLIGLVLLKRLVATLFPQSVLPLPPGPAPLPIIGNAHQAPKERPWLQYHEWSKQYGPIVYLNMAGQSVIILSSTRTAHDLLSRRGAQYSDRPYLVVAGELVTKGLHMLLRPYDAAYRLHQRMESPVLSPRAANAYRPLQEVESRQLLLDLLAGSDSAGEKGADFNHWFERATASSIYALLYGYRLKTGHEQELVYAKHVQTEAVKSIQVGAHLVDSFPVLNYLPGILAPWKKAAETLWQLERSLHLGNLDRGLSNPGWNFSKHMKASTEGNGMSPEELAFDLGILADAALDTTSMTLDWLIVAWITQNKGWVAKAQRLLDDVVGKRLPQFDDRPNLSYIEAIMQEILRWRPAVPGGVPHMTKTKDEYLGYRIPAGSVVVANHWSITREEAVFGPKTDEFSPERWLAPDDDNTIKYNNGIKDLPSTGFGFGRRVCTGQHIARNFLFVNIARLLWAFDVEAGILEKGGERGPIDPMACTAGFSVRPLPFKAVFKPRGPWVRGVVEKDCRTHTYNLASILDQAAADR